VHIQPNILSLVHQGAPFGVGSDANNQNVLQRGALL
jgi:hypothetical protein